MMTRQTSLAESGDRILSMARAADVAANTQLILHERDARDRMWRVQMRDCYHYDAEVYVAWYQGGAASGASPEWTRSTSATRWLPRFRANRFDWTLPPCACCGRATSWPRTSLESEATPSTRSFPATTSPNRWRRSIARGSRGRVSAAQWAPG